MKAGIDVKPNILFIMADQLRFDCLGCNGNDVIETPAIDRLAGESANFSSFFIQAPVCVPSRQTFFTGRYPHQHRNRVNYTSMDGDVRLMQEYLRDSGYATGFAGKLHYFPPTSEYALSTGFDRGYLHDAGPVDDYSDYTAWLESKGIAWKNDAYRKCRSDATNPYTTELSEEYHETTWCGEMTRKLLLDFSKQDRPFFVFSSYWKPHSPFEIPEPWASMYDNTDIGIPERVTEGYIRNLPKPVYELASREGIRYFETPEEDILWKYRSYYGAVSQIDLQVGLTLGLLEELGLSDNTIVVFCSDHGDMMYAHGLIDKNYFFEDAIHVPFMIRLPGRIMAGSYNEMVESTDFLPSIFELCGIDVPYGNQGLSFAPLITGIGEYTKRKYVFAENIIPEVHTGFGMGFSYEKGKGIRRTRHPDAKMVRSDKWKYNYYIEDEELYDLENDPGEKQNLARTGGYDDVINELRKELLDWMITSNESDQIAPGWYNVKNQKGEWELWREWGKRK